MIRMLVAAPTVIVRTLVVLPRAPITVTMNYRVTSYPFLLGHSMKGSPRTRWREWTKNSQAVQQP